MNEPIIYNIVCRACFRALDGQRFDMPVCFSVWDLQDKDLLDRDLFLAAVLNNLGIGDDNSKKDTKNCELLRLEIATYSIDDLPYTEPLWLQKEHTYYFENNKPISEPISEAQSDLKMIKNTYTDKSAGNLFMVLSPKGYGKYASLYAIRADKTIPTAQTFTHNRYMQIIEAGYKIGDVLYGTPYDTITKLTLKEKLFALERNHVGNKYIQRYSAPMQLIYGFVLAFSLAGRILKGQASVFEIQHDALILINKTTADYKLQRWLAVFSTFIYAYFAYLIFR